MNRPSSLYSFEHPTHHMLVTHISRCKTDGLRDGLPLTHILRIAAEAAPGASRHEFIMAAVSAGFNVDTAGIQFTNSRKLTFEMLEMDFPEFVGPFPVLMVGRR